MRREIEAFVGAGAHVGKHPPTGVVGVGVVIIIIIADRARIPGPWWSSITLQYKCCFLCICIFIILFIIY